MSGHAPDPALTSKSNRQSFSLVYEMEDQKLSMTGADGLPARLVVEIKPPPDLVSGNVKVTADILEHEVVLDAAPPPASKVIETPPGQAA